MSDSEKMRELNLAWLVEAAKREHLFRYRWLGERFFHLPADMLAIQELLWRVQPEVVIQTGIAAGGGSIFVASMLELIGGSGEVLAIDPHLTQTTREALTRHRMGRRIQILDGSSTDPGIYQQVISRVGARSPVLVVLDLIHTHAHVKRELELYAPVVTRGSYVIVLDTILEDLPEEMTTGHRWGKGNNPATAVREFLSGNSRFEVDREIEEHVVITLAPGGFLRRVE